MFSSGSGGGVYINGDTSVTIPSRFINCVFDGNTATEIGGDLPVGGGLATLDDDTEIVNCLFTSNSAAEGGAIYTSSTDGLVANCTVTENSATSQGGGIWANTADIQNSVVWNNLVGATRNLASNVTVSGTITVNNSCIDDGTIGGSVPFGGAPNGNIDTDPSFVDPDGPDGIPGTADDPTPFTLALGSPCIDTGDSTLVPADVGNVDEDADLAEPTPLDLALQDRFVFAGLTSGGGADCVVDMGAFEFEQAASCGSLDYGDMNQDGNWDGLDIQPFVDCFLTTPVEDQDCNCALGDFGRNPGVEINDIPLFVQCILTGGVDCEPFFCSSGPRSGFDDCNNNGTPDDVDILTGCDPVTAPELCDCNNNGLPDGCDITASTSDDVNNNDVPDECEPDCNNNDIPDDKDIPDATSADCDSNGVPDECDQDCDADGTPDACETLIDCDGNGIFDACQLDCDNDGVPNACELSGNDCNENNIPDDCEIDRDPPFNLPDCNDNGVPDACDIADCVSDPACYDCNGNNIPDECDIANAISDDTNSNGIPDECESQQQSQSGGGGGGTSMMMSPTPGAGGAPGGGAHAMQTASTTATWDAFHAWCAATDFSGMTAGEKFAAIVDKQIELGIPVGQMFPKSDHYELGWFAE